MASGTSAGAAAGASTSALFAEALNSPLPSLQQPSNPAGPSGLTTLLYGAGRRVLSAGLGALAGATRSISIGQRGSSNEEQQAQDDDGEVSSRPSGSGSSAAPSPEPARSPAAAAVEPPAASHSPAASAASPAAAAARLAVPAEAASPQADGAALRVIVMTKDGKDKEVTFTQEDVQGERGAGTVQAVGAAHLAGAPSHLHSPSAGPHRPTCRSGAVVPGPV